MKKITNWRNATVADFEADGFLEQAKTLHVNSFDMANGKKGTIDGEDHDRLIKFFNYHIDNGIPLVYHNGICFDVPLAEKILKIDLSKLMLIDTLPLSWYLNIERKIHGLDSFFDDYGIRKPKVSIDEWITPIKGIETDVVKVGKGKDAEEVVRYKYIGLPFVYHKDYGIDISKIDLNEVAKLESDESYNQRVIEHKQLMTHRCEMDVAINRALWNDFMSRLEDMYSTAKFAIDSGLVDGTRMSKDEVCYIDQFKRVGTVDDHIDRILTFLMFKMDCARLQEKTRWKADVEHLRKTELKLSGIIEEAKSALEAVMPRVPVYSSRKKPAKPYLKDEVTLSASGERWNALVDKIGLKDADGNELVIYSQDKPNELKELTGYDKPNAGSSDQIKSWLFKNGWKPITFKYVKDKDAQQSWADSGFKKELKPEPRKVPQVSVDGDDGKELCQSVVDLSEEVPEVMYYNKYTTVKSRLDNIRGMLRDVSSDGYLKARIGGFTNTLRVKHRELVNLTGVDKPYGEDIRGSLTCEEWEVMEGSDLSSLEDRTKHHFMLPHDPKYVATMMSDDYDPHILTAHSAGMITDQELADFKLGKVAAHVKSARKAGKTTNYAAVYNSGAETLARSSGLTVKEAKDLLDGYWKLNWAVKAIAEEQYVFTCSQGKMWMVNPINGFCYSLRKESDKFSTLCQGTGSFFFDMWVDNILEAMLAMFKTKRLTGSFHKLLWLLIAI